jgi:hypothetical protein
MRYSQFIRSIQKSGVAESARCYGHIIEQYEDGAITIDGEQTEYVSLEEARQSVIQEHATTKLEEEISKDTYEEISDNTVASIIKEHYDIKVTDTLIESYVQFASSNIFTVDPVVQKIRSLNKLDRLIEGRIQYVLNDESIVTISESTQDLLNKLLQNQTEIIEYMRESKESFMHVLTKIEEQ